MWSHLMSLSLPFVNSIVSICVINYNIGNFFCPPPKKKWGNREIFGEKSYFLVVKNRVLGKKNLYKNKFVFPKTLFFTTKKKKKFPKISRFPPLFDPFMGEGILQKPTPAKCQNQLVFRGSEKTLTKLISEF